MQFLLFFASLIFLIFFANFLVKSSEKLSASVKISPLIVGATLIAFGTSLPELSVMLSSLFQNAQAISLGNLVGSNICNSLLILGLSFLLFPIRIGTEKTQKNNSILIIITILFSAVFFLPLLIRQIILTALALFYFVFVATEIVWGEKGKNKEDKKALAKMEKAKANPLSYGLKIFLALIGLIASSKFLVSSAVALANFFNIEQEIIGLSLVAIGTSLPELSTSVASGFKKDWKLIIGDIQGSNIINLALLGSITLLFSGSVNRTENMLPLFFLLASAVLLFVLTKKYVGKTVPRPFGLLFLSFYSIYLFSIFFI